MSPGPSEGSHQLIVVSGRAQNSTQMNPSQLYSKSGSEEEKKITEFEYLWVFYGIEWYFIYIFLFFFPRHVENKGKGEVFPLRFFFGYGFTMVDFFCRKMF